MSPHCLLATVDFPPGVSGGIQRYYYDFCRKSGGRIAVLAPRAQGCTEFDNAQSFPVKRVNLPMDGHPVSRALLTFIVAFHTLRALLSGHYTKLIVGHWFLLPPLVWIGHWNGARVAVVMHGGELSRFRAGSTSKRLMVSLINRCDQVIVNSSYTANQFIDHGVERKKIRILTPAVDSDLYRPEPSRGPMSLAGETQFCGITLLTVATLVERKGHAAVISVLPKILSAYGPGSVRYIIVGDGPNRATLANIVEQLNLTSTVHFMGRVTDEEVIRWLHECDIFVMPSGKVQGKFGEEGFGIVYLEANACGKPVIGGDSGGVKEAVIHNATGLLVEPDDNESLFRALDRLIGSKNLRETLGQNGRSRVVREFQWADRIETFVGAPLNHG